MRDRLIVVVILLTIGLAMAPLGLTRREARVDARAEPYAAELRAHPGDGGTLALSPDGRYVAFSPRVVSSFAKYAWYALTTEYPPYIFSPYHTVSVLDAGSGDVRSIVTILEADPYSGTSHRVRWSADGRAILIVGRGSIGGGATEELCLVFRVDADELIRPAACR